MTEHNPENEELAARFRLDQEAASEAESSREQIVWDQRVRDAETTLDQREAVTRLVVAKAKALEALEAVVWLLVVAAVVVALGLGVRAIVEAFQ